MNLKEIRELIDLITEKGIAEFELERAGVRLKINRQGSVRVVERQSLPAETTIPMAGPPPSGMGMGARSTLPPASAISPTSAPAAEYPSEELFVVRAPMVGTFYSAPGQDTPPFVQAGDRVRVGQVLCIIEAMKLMNKMEAEVEGEVVQSYVKTGQPVEFGEPLFDIRPAVSAKKRGG